MQVPTKQDVVQGGEIRKELNVLKHAGHTEPGDLVWFHGEQAGSFEVDGTLLGPIHAIQTVEDRRLAGAIWADNRKQFTLVDIKTDAIHGDNACERQSHPIEYQQGITHDSQRFRRL